MRVLKRKIRGRIYYYLQHSFRKGNKVITREKYLGREIPSGIEGMKEAFLEECYKASLHRLFERIKKNFQREWGKYPESAKDKVIEQISVAFTYNTNAIEGSKITLEETRELLEHKISPNKPLFDVKESESHAKVFLEMLGNKEKFGIPLILKWHNELFKDTKTDIAGIFRDYPIRVGDYRAPDWQDVEDLMKGLMEFYNKNKNMNPVELSARMHYKFEKIHPFGDGNGRIGRLLMNYILWHNEFPMLIIEYKKRGSYYMALQKDENGFLNYFARRYLTAHKRYIRPAK